MSERSDSRQHKRFAVDIKATVTVDGRLLSARSRDLSRSGICLIMYEEIRPGAPLSVGLTLALSPTSVTEPLKLDARVAWCTLMFGAYQVGAMFVGLTPDQGRYIEMFLSLLDGGGRGNEDTDPGTDRDDDDSEHPSLRKRDPFDE